MIGLRKVKFLASKMAQWVTVLSTQALDLNLISRTHITLEEGCIKLSSGLYIYRRWYSMPLHTDYKIKIFFSKSREVFSLNFFADVMAITWSLYEKILTTYIGLMSEYYLSEKENYQYRQD